MPKAEEEPTLKDEDLSRSKLFIPLVRAETLTEENISAISQENFPAEYFKIPTSLHSQSVYSLFTKATSTNTIQIEEVPTGGRDKNCVLKKKEIRTMLLCEDKDFQGYLELDSPLLQSTPKWNESQIPIYVDKTFGVQGIKVFGSVLISLDEQFAFNDGIADLKLSDVMNGAGYKRGPNRAYKTKDREEVIKILDLILSTKYAKYEEEGNQLTWKKYHIFITLSEEGQATRKRTTRLPKKESSLDGSEKIELEDYYAPDRLDRKIQANPVWYSDSFASKAGSSPQYTIAQKRLYALPLKHEIVIGIGNSLWVEWRSNPGEPYLARSVKTLLDRANLSLKGKNLSRDIKRLFQELDYMKAEGFIGDYARKPSESGESLSEVIHLYPPEQTREINQKIASKRFNLLGNGKKKESLKAISPQELSSLIEKSGLSANKFAEKVGVTPGLLSKIKKGEKKLSFDLSQSIRGAFPSLMDNA